MNKLFYGDNLDILRSGHIPEESVDLIYIDPPFNSNRTYNVVFDGASAQAEAFNDTWSLRGIAAELSLIFDEEPQRYNKIHNILNAYKSFLQNSNPSLFAYLTHMAVRVVELHKVLKKTGSFYLHCDPTASHYLKPLLDEVFGRNAFRNEIVWCYKSRHMSKKHFGRKHDIIFFYSKSDDYYFNWEANLQPLSESTIRKYKHEDEFGRYRLVGRGIKDSPIRSAKDVDRKWEETRPELVKRDYLKEGYPLEDYWTIDIINQASRERLGYPTQKPEALLERIIKASSKEGDVVLDAFCGCGTTIAVAQRLKRKWIGVDITFLAVDLIRQRLLDKFYRASLNLNERKALERFNKEVVIFGIPRDLEGAKQLAKNTSGDRTRKEFEKWAIFSVGGVFIEKKGADSGIDGYFFIDELNENNQRVKIKGLIQVKSGKTGVAQIRDFNGTLDKEKAPMGIFITLEEPTRPMLDFVSSLPKYKTKLGNSFDKITIVTVKEIIEDSLPQLPIQRATKQAVREREPNGQADLIK